MRRTWAYAMRPYVSDHDGRYRSALGRAATRPYETQIRFIRLPNSAVCPSTLTLSISIDAPHRGGQPPDPTAPYVRLFRLSVEQSVGGSVFPSIDTLHHSPSPCLPTGNPTRGFPAGRGVLLAQRQRSVIAISIDAPHRGAINLRPYTNPNPLHRFHQIRWQAVQVLMPQFKQTWLTSHSRPSWPSCTS